VAAALDQILERAQLPQPDRAARVQLLVELPISAPIPYSPPSVKRVEALT